MTKGQMQELLCMLQELCDIQKKIKEILKDDDMEMAKCELLECQKRAICIGNKIEMSEGEGTQAVKQLEDYCEDVYQLYIGKLSEEAVSNILEKKLQQAIADVRKIAIQKEIVFLPYKASMWDSLESIWQEKCQGNGCKVYVIPIPYFDKDIDGNFYKMHYEGGQYPSYVEVTDYKNYRIEDRKPDEIYIHNPYDGVNRVTSVAPEFYASNLKKYTGKLVYVPYFVLDEIEPDDKAQIETMKQFCLLPGVLHSSQVIVQSEKMRQIYINELVAAFHCEKNVQVTNYWKNKIQVGVSPKLKKVSSIKKEDVDIPKDWYTVLKKNDGTNKKVVFYNTGINAFLQYKERLLKKMEYVFQLFKKQSDKIAFLWRPHPLMKATIKADSPQLLEWYNKIEQEYQEEKWGIYDNTSDLSRAIAISDVYYGDKSSVDCLFRQTGKMAIIQNVDINRSEQDDLIGTYGIVERSGVHYFTSKCVNGLFCYDDISRKVKFLEEFQTKQEMFSYMSGDIVDDTIIFPPYLAEAIAIYHVSDKKMEYIYDDRIKNARINRIIPYRDKKVILFNEDSLEKSYIFDVSEKKLNTLQEYYQISSEILKKTKARNYKDFCVVDSVVYIPGEKPDSVVIFYMETGNIEVRKITNLGIHYMTICYDGKSFWLSGDMEVIVRWTDGETKLINDMPNGFCSILKGSWLGNFGCSIYMGGYVYLFPTGGNMIVRINVLSAQIEVVKADMQHVVCPFAQIWSKNEIYVEVDYPHGEMVYENFILNTVTGEIQKNVLQLRDRCEKDKLKKMYCNKENVLEEITELKVLDMILDEEKI